MRYPENGRERGPRETNARPHRPPVGIKGKPLPETISKERG